MAREINAELLDVKIEKAQADLVKARHRYDAAAATLKNLLDKLDALRQKNCWMLLLKADGVMKRSYSIYRARLKRRINYQWNIILQSDMVTLLYFFIIKICAMFKSYYLRTAGMKRH